MRLQSRQILPALVLVAAAVGQSGVGLRDLPALAKVRGEQQRVALSALLEPLLADLRLQYSRNSKVVDPTIDKVVAFGEPIVPLLLDLLTPEPGQQVDAHLASNAARVLARLEPSQFLDALIELVDGEHVLGRELGIWLLGDTGEPRALEAIVRAFPRLQSPQEIETALEAAQEFRSAALVHDAIPQLQRQDRELRGTILRYLTAVEAGDARSAVLAALGGETEPRLLEEYIAYFAGNVTEDEQVADALIDLVRGVRLDPDAEIAAVIALRTIAPKGHRTTKEVLRTVIEDTRNKSARVRIAAAVTLEAIGDRNGARQLFKTLNDRARANSQDAEPLAERAEAHFAFNNFKDAIADYQRALEQTGMSSRRALLFLQIARCEAHRENSARMARALRDSGQTAATIRLEASKDPVFQKALEEESIQRFLRSLEDH